MKPFHSIRWRLQFWHGLLLAGVLGGFGFALWELFRADQLRRVDEELDQRLAVFIADMQRDAGRPGPPPQGLEPGGIDGPPPPRGRRPPGERPWRPEHGGPPGAPPPFDAPPPRLDARDFARDFAEVDESRGHYYVAWPSREGEPFRSSTAPADATLPREGTLPRNWRMRGTLREFYHFPPSGGCFLVGRDVGGTLSEIRRFAWLAGGAGVVVLGVGLAGGWWISTRALRPIADISAAAAKIATGDLSQRVRVKESGSELAELAHVLNQTFARLQASFARQAQFTADAAHELRTPVTVLLTETQAALSRERDGTEYRESLAACQRAAQRMRRLTESLLLLARLDSGDGSTSFESCELGEIAREAIELLRPVAMERNVSISLQLPQAPVRCSGNPERLGQVVGNLLHNAVAYNREGGNVNVEVRSDAGSALLIVADTGQGINPEDLPHIFERFYRADKARSGAPGHSGLGLAITKAIVDAHGGSIHVTSEPGVGSRFEVRLPRVVEPSEAWGISPKTNQC